MTESAQRLLRGQLIIPPDNTTPTRVVRVIIVEDIIRGVRTATAEVECEGDVHFTCSPTDRITTPEESP